MNRRGFFKGFTAVIASFTGVSCKEKEKPKMPDTSANIMVSNPVTPFTMSRSFKACSNGKIFIGKPDTDPTIAENQIPVFVENEGGSTVQVSQPLVINSAGYPVYNGQPAKFVTTQNHSMAVYDSYMVQQFYWGDISKFDAAFVIYELNKLKDELSSQDGLKLIGRCPDLATLATIEPEVEWQIIDVIARVKGGTWGGGKFVYLPSATTQLYPAISGAIIWTPGGKCWIREGLISNAVTRGTVFVEWFSDVPEGLLQDWSPAINAANTAAETLVKSLNPRWGRHIEIVTPRFFGMYSSATININAAYLNGNLGTGCVNPSGTFNAHPMASDTTYTVSAAAVANFKYAILLYGGTVSVDVSNHACYFDHQYVNDLSLGYGTPLSDVKIPYNEITSLPSTVMTAFVHYGVAAAANDPTVTGTVQTAQGSMRNVSAVGFGCGYSNGNYAWGLNCYDCKWPGCYYGQFLIAGADNGERYNFFGNVWQNGYHGYWSENWAGDAQFHGGSMVWLRGRYLKIAPYNTFDANLSRVEHVLSTSELVYMDDAGTTASIYPNWNKCKFRPTLLIMSRVNSTSTTFDLFRVGQYRELDIDCGAVSWNSYALSPNIRLANPDALGKINFKGNPMRIGAWRQFKQVPRGANNRASNLANVAKTYAATTANASYSVVFGNTNHNLTGAGDITLTCNADTAANFFADMLIPIDGSNIKSLKDLYPFLRASKNTFTSAALIGVYLRSDNLYTYGAAGSAGDLEVKVGDINLSSFQTGTDITLFPGGGIYPFYYDNVDSLPFIPTHLRLNIYIPGTVGVTAGQSITIIDAGIAGF